MDEDLHATKDFDASLTERGGDEETTEVIANGDMRPASTVVDEMLAMMPAETTAETSIGVVSPRDVDGGSSTAVTAATTTKEQPTEVLLETLQYSEDLGHDCQTFDYLGNVEPL